MRMHSYYIHFNLINYDLPVALRVTVGGRGGAVKRTAAAFLE